MSCLTAGFLTFVAVKSSSGWVTFTLSVGQSRWDVEEEGEWAEVGVGGALSLLGRYNQAGWGAGAPRLVLERTWQG